ncbi:hypothetical protein FNV43_RR22699 [Rhamnella rubrinervis]|uniref:DUF7086 domain-containing protein n=1 Tax=Rhamnella rubrinervis TaxID=2594499 RepID=A0A8K0DUS9_9ROSA|nr:hypothetical protein FNV43_RR22699 [Rhamnella rubrinervis]
MNDDEELLNNEQEINRKRKNNQDCSSQVTTTKFSSAEEDDNDLLTLSLSFRSSRPRRLSPVVEQQPQLSPPRPPPPPPPPSPSLSMQALLNQNTPQLTIQMAAPNSIFGSPLVPDCSQSSPYIYRHQESAGPSSRPLRVRRNPTQAPREGKSETVPAPFPWATTHRATVHSYDYLVGKQIFTITGEVQCKRCERQYEMEYDLKEKFNEVAVFIFNNKCTMHDRAPSVWMNPVLPTCKSCKQENSAKPIISEKKKTINWLFLLLGQMLGCCTLEQLKYFCKHTKNHRTGAKDRVLYLTYLGLCKQLDPTGPFDR